MLYIVLMVVRRPPKVYSILCLQAKVEKSAERASR